jgi:hypothetical protein
VRDMTDAKLRNVNEVPEEGRDTTGERRARGVPRWNLAVGHQGSVRVLSSAVRKGVSLNARRLIYPVSPGRTAEVRRGAAPSHGGPERRVSGAKRSAHERRCGGGAVRNLHYANPVVYDRGISRFSGYTPVGGVRR